MVVSVVIVIHRSVCCFVITHHLTSEEIQLYCGYFFLTSLNTCVSYYSQVLTFKTEVISPPSVCLVFFIFLGCPSVQPHIIPMLVEALSQDRIEEISSSVAQIFTWTQG